MIFPVNAWTPPTIIAGKIVGMNGRIFRIYRLDNVYFLLPDNLVKLSYCIIDDIMHTL